jgi:hypothetical protein
MGFDKMFYLEMQIIGFLYSRASIVLGLVFE